MDARDMNSASLLYPRSLFRDKASYATHPWWTCIRSAFRSFTNLPKGNHVVTSGAAYIVSAAHVDLYDGASYTLFSDSLSSRTAIRTMPEHSAFRFGVATASLGFAASHTLEAKLKALQTAGFKYCELGFGEYVAWVRSVRPDVYVL